LVQTPALGETIKRLIRDFLGRIWHTGVLCAPVVQISGVEGGVVAPELLEHLGHPAPVLEHVARRFAEVAGHVGAVEAGVLCSGEKVVHAVTEFCGDLVRCDVDVWNGDGMIGA
jgi:hypothetical protein